jgi:predicted Zn-dependent protease
MVKINNINRREFLEIFGGCSCGLLIASCGTAPITERKQLKLIPESTLNSQAAQIFENVRNKTKLSDDKKQLEEIKEIGSSIENAVSSYFVSIGKKDPTYNFQWDYILIDNDKIKNAWCMPGGKIAVYSGILPIAKNNDGIASIMGHEIAHAVARHSAERASRSILMDAGTYALERFVLGTNMTGYSRDLYSQLRQIGLELPFSFTFLTSTEW